jgi:hypothetical protein
MTKQEYQNGDVPTPPVTVIAIPKEYGTRGYGGKISGNQILIPYNKSTEDTFSDVPEKRVMIVIRKRFNELEDTE